MMAINPEAIERFLAYVRTVPTVYDQPPEMLHHLILRSTKLAFTPNTPARDYQLEAVAFFLWLGRGLVFMKPRLGKTKVFLDWAEHLRKAGQWQKKGLVILPSETLHSVWQGEIAKHSHLTADYINSTDPARWRQALDSPRDLVIVAWGALQYLFSIPKSNKKGGKEFAPNHPFLAESAEAFDLIGIDEIHTTKDPTSLRFAIADGLTQRARFALGLTGTPHGRNPFDIWAQAYLIDRGRTFGNSYFFFMQAFGERKRFPFTPSGYQWRFAKSKKEYFEQRLASCSLSYGWAGRLALPSIARYTVPLTLAEEQKAAYRKVLAAARTAARQGNPRPAFMALRQISSGILPYTTEHGKRALAPLPCSKMEWLNALFATMDESLKTIIFHEFTETGRRLHRHLTRAKIGHRWLHGATPAAERGAAIAAFQTGDVQVMLIHPKVGALGIDLPAADYMCFVESPLSPTIREQAEARPMAARAERALVIDDLICSPVEQRIYECLAEGKNLLNELVFGRRSWDALEL